MGGPAAGAAGPGGAALPGPLTGVIDGPVRSSAVPATAHTMPGLVAVTIAAVIALAAVAGRALAGDLPRPLLIVGLVVPPLLIVAAALATRAGGGAGAIRRFRLRPATGPATDHTLHTTRAGEALNPGDLVRLVPGRRGPRAVEVVASLDGPMIRRLEAAPAVPPAQWAGLIVAAGLLIAAALLLLGRF
jgi:hypothetical protein